MTLHSPSPACVSRTGILLSCAVLALGLSACAPLSRLGTSGVAVTPAPPEHIERRLDRLLPADVLLLGEQHDAAEHQLIERQVV